jgi:hypothetical protein
MTWEEFKVQRQRLGLLLEAPWATLDDAELDSAGDKWALFVEALERRHGIQRKHAQLLLVRWFAGLPSNGSEAIAANAIGGTAS